MTPLTMAVPKGRILEPLAGMLARAGVDTTEMMDDSRRLMARDPESGIAFILAKPADVPTYVEYGAADLGVVGKDILLERRYEVAELLDLGFGACKLIVAVPEASGLHSVKQLDFNSRVASKFPGLTAAYFNDQGIQVDVIPLHGAIELAPLVGLAEAIVDITETGRSLRENGLTVIATIADVTTRLIANPVRHKIHHHRIEELVGRLRETLSAETGAAQRS